MNQDRSTAQTLSRGLQIIEVLAESDGPMTAQDLAAAIGVSRPIAYRLLRTLEAHGLLDAAAPEGQFALGLGLLTLSRSIVRDLREAAFPELAQLTKVHKATSFVGMREGDDLVCVASAEPETQAMAIRHREGMRIPFRGAGAWAILAGAAPQPEESQQVETARRQGYAISEGEIFSGIKAIASPIYKASGSVIASLTLVISNPDDLNLDKAVTNVTEAAARISRGATM